MSWATRERYRQTVLHSSGGWFHYVTFVQLQRGQYICHRKGLICCYGLIFHALICIPVSAGSCHDAWWCCRLSYSQVSVFDFRCVLCCAVLCCAHAHYTCTSCCLVLPCCDALWIIDACSHYLHKCKCTWYVFIIIFCMCWYPGLVSPQPPCIPDA